MQGGVGTGPRQPGWSAPDTIAMVIRLVLGVKIAWTTLRSGIGGSHGHRRSLQAQIGRGQLNADTIRVNDRQPGSEFVRRFPRRIFRG